MRYLLDANLSPTIADDLLDAGFDALHVGDIGMLSATDEEIFERAVREPLVVVTADSDFAMLLAARRTDSPSIVLLRDVAGFGPSVHAALLLANLRSVEEALRNGAIVAMSPKRIRIRDLPIT